MSVEQHLSDVVARDGAAHLTLIDPDSQSPAEAGVIAKEAEAGGTDGIMIGGSTGAGGPVLDDTVLAIKDNCNLPTVLFPSSAGGVCQHADAIFFMSLLNSRDTNYLITNQMLGAPLVHKYGIEPIPMAYIIAEPGGTVGWIGDVRLIPHNKPAIAAAYALAGKYLGMRYTYLEAGSGADKPIPPKMIGATKHAIGSNMLIVGGGIRDGATAKICSEAGADIIVTGTVVEDVSDVEGKVREFVDAIKIKR